MFMSEAAAVINELIKQGRIQQRGNSVEMSIPDILCFGAVLYEYGMIKQELSSLKANAASQKKTEEYQSYALKAASILEAKLKAIGGMAGGEAPC